jgi:putative ABC transport system substrate-binding protein
MNRRDTLIAVLALGAIPFGAEAQQQGKVWRIGFLSSYSGMNRNVEAFLEGLRSFGYIEGRNLFIEYRWAAGHEERLPALAAELVALNVDLIATQATGPIAAAQRATRSIPILMTAPNDPLGGGLVASLAHPGGNVTGMTMQSNDLAEKDLQLVRELGARATRVGVLAWKIGLAGRPFFERMQTTANKLGVTLVFLQASDPKELEGIFATIERTHVQALIVQHGTFTDKYRKTIVELVARQRLPAIYGSIGFVEAGGLMSFGPNLPALYRQSATYVDKILKGAKPGDLPIEQPTRFELVINLKTAKALGIKVPQSLLLRADRVIE